LSPAEAALLEAKKAAKLAQLAAAKARTAANEANIEAEKEHDIFHSSILTPIQPSTKPLPTNPASLNQLQTTSQQQQQNTKRKKDKGKSKHKRCNASTRTMKMPLTNRTNGRHIMNIR
jgi:hypothetical protein